MIEKIVIAVIGILIVSCILGFVWDVLVCDCAGCVAHRERKKRQKG
jgi:hypothetical protein